MEVVLIGILSGIGGLFWGTERHLEGNTGVYAGLVRKPKAPPPPSPTPSEPAPSHQGLSSVFNNQPADQPSSTPAASPAPTPAPAPAAPMWQPVDVSPDGTFSLSPGTYRASTSQDVSGFTWSMLVQPQLASKGLTNIQHWSVSDAPPSDWPADDAGPKTRIQADATQSGSATLPGIRVWKKTG
jgi:hypothetical protein